MERHKSKNIKVILHPTAVKVAHILDKLDTETLDDTNVDYKRLYYRAFNGLADILGSFGYPDVSNPALERIARLQEELENQFIND